MKLRRISAIVILALATSFTGVTPADAAPPESLDGSGLIYGETRNIWGCWSLTKKEFKHLKPILQVKVHGKWKKVAKGKIKKGDKRCKGAYPYIIKYTWTVDELGSASSKDHSTKLQMREALKRKHHKTYYNLWVQSVYASESDWLDDIGQVFCDFGLCG